MPCKSMKVKILQGLKGCLVEIVCKVLQDNNDITTSEELSVELKFIIMLPIRENHTCLKVVKMELWISPWFTCALVLNIIWSLTKKLL